MGFAGVPGARWSAALRWPPAWLSRPLENILTYLRHRIGNAAIESLNSKIQWAKYTARGFRNKRNLQTAIYFHCAGLDLTPSTH